MVWCGMVDVCGVVVVWFGMMWYSECKMVLGMWYGVVLCGVM